MKVTGVFFRGHDPKWSWSPLSGQGAANLGGRWNVKGMPALYLSASPEICLNELGYHLSERIQPLTLCSYDVDVVGVADLTNELERGRLGISLTTMRSPWKDFVTNGKQPPTWEIALKLARDRWSGILVPSFAVAAKPDHTNLVLWKWGPDLPHKVLVYDPTGRLPKNQLSWD